MFEFHPSHAFELHSKFFKFPCRQRILMVTDGSLSFNAGGFGLSVLVGMLSSAGHTVTTARRQGGGGASIAGAFDFAEADIPVNVNNYDQLWLFGFSTGSLSPKESATVAKFMQSGGGVLATGDHETIGSGMGSALPRVRAMRNWASIPMSNPDRLDTVVSPGADEVKEFDDQADEIAQRIYPVWFSNGGPANIASSWSVHPVLRYPSGAVDVLPDHPHESECLAPAPTPGSFAGVVEWPLAPGSAVRPGPEIAAVSISAGRFVTDSLKPPVRPRCFGAISVYDGDKAGVGRILCDATWHHFVNINLNGAGGTPDTEGNPRRGFFVGDALTADGLKIRAYFLNAARWLAPVGRRHCWPFFKFAVLRYHLELLEVQIPRPEPCPWGVLVHIGQRVEEILVTQVGPGAQVDLLAELLSATRPPPALLASLDPAGALAAEPALAALSNELRHGVFGTVINLLARELPEDEALLERMLGNGLGDLGAKLLPEGVRLAEGPVAERIANFARSTAEFARGVVPSKPDSAGKRRPTSTKKRGGARKPGRG